MKRYFMELASKQQFVDELLNLEKRHGFVTLLYSARGVEHNNAAALSEYIKHRRSV